MTRLRRRQPPHRPADALDAPPGLMHMAFPMLWPAPAAGALA